MLNDPAILVSAFLLGFLGSAHCLGMCGGLAAALGLTNKSSSQSPIANLLAYNIGRISSYCLAGLIVGLFGFWLSQQLAAFTLLRYLAGIMLILMGLYLGNWFNGLIFAEKLGQSVWKLVQLLSKRFMPVRNAKDAFGAGLVWGWLPCGLVYSALIWASVEASVGGSMLIMLCFGLGTLPSMLTTGLFAQYANSIIRHQYVRKASGSLMILFGLWTLPYVQIQLVNVFN